MIAASGDLFVRRTLNSLTGASPSALHHCLAVAAVDRASERASYSTVFLSIDKHRHAETQIQRAEDDEYRKTERDHARAPPRWRDRLVVRMTEQTYRTAVRSLSRSQPTITAGGRRTIIAGRSADTGISKDRTNIAPSLYGARSHGSPLCATVPQKRLSHPY